MINDFNLKYNELLNYILMYGTDKEDRTGVGTKSTFTYNFKLDISKEFPLLTTKKVHFKSVLTELLWFISGDTNTKFLEENKVKIWRQWQDENGDLGPIYGHQWRSWGSDQLQTAIDTINSNPDSRRIVVSSWNVNDLPEMALMPCHLYFQFHSLPTENGKRKLNLFFLMRSSDVFLGLPFNVASYALLLHMVAQLTDHEVGELAYTGVDVHLYSNHIEQTLRMLMRDCSKYSMPSIKINPDVKSIDDFTHSDFELIDYQSYPSIKAPVAV